MLILFPQTCILLVRKLCCISFKTTNPNPPDELDPNVSKKSLLDELFLHFPSKVHNLTVFSIIYMIRIRFFGSGELIQRTFRAARYDKFVIDDNMDSDTVTESNLSLRSFLNRVNDRLRKILDHSSKKKCNARHRQTFYDLGNVRVFAIGSICIHGKELLRQFTFHQKDRRMISL